MQTFLIRLTCMLAAVLIAESAGQCQDTARSLEIAQQVTPFGNSAFALALDSEHSRIAIAGHRGTVAVYDTTAFSEIARLESDEGMVLAMAFDAKKQHLLVAGDPKRLCIYSTDDWQLLRTIELPFRCGFLSVHPRRPIVALAGVGNAILFYDYESGRSVGRMNRNLQRAFDLAFTPNGDQLLAVAKTTGVTVSAFNFIAIDTKKLQESDFALSSPAFLVLANSYSEFGSLAMSPDTRRLAVIDKGGQILLYHTETLSNVRKIQGELGNSLAMTFVSNSDLVVASENTFLHFQLSGDSEPLIAQTEMITKLNHLQMDTQTGRLFASHARARNQLTVWNVAAEGPAPNMIAEGFAGPIASSKPQRKIETEMNDSQIKTENTPNQATNSDQFSEMTPRDADEESHLEQPADAANKSRAKLFLASKHPSREWTDAASGRTLEAYLIGIDGKDVLLRLPSAHEFVLARDRLTDSDQQYLLDVESQYHGDIDWPQHIHDPIATGFCNLLSIQIGAAKTDSLAESDLNPMNVGTSPFRTNFAVTRAVPDKRGAFYLATTVGLAKYDPSTGLVIPLTGAPMIERSPLPTPTDSIDDLIVDRFGRAIVRFQKSSQVFRWNGFDWVHLWSDIPHIRSLINTRHGIYGVAQQQPPHTIAKLPRPENSLVTLGADDKWHTVDVTYDGQVVRDLEMILPLEDNRLLGVRENESPLIIEHGAAQTLDAPGLTTSKLSWVTAPLPGPVVDSNGRIYFLRAPLGPKSFGRAELVRVDASGTHVWSHDAEFIDQDQPSHVAVNHLGRVFVRMRNGKIFSPGDDNALNSVSGPAESSYRTDVSLYSKYELRDAGMKARTLSPFVHSRLWTSTRGTRLNATCEDLDGERARLRDADGRVVDVGLKDLTDQDRQYLANLAWHRQAIRSSSGSFKVISRQRTRRGSFTNWDDMPEAEKAAVLPMIYDVSLNPNAQSEISNFIATTRGLETWDGTQLRLLTPVPDASQGADPRVPAAWGEVLAAPDGSVLGVFHNTGQVFEYRDQWKLTKGSEHFKLSHLKTCGDTVYGVAIHQPPGKPKTFGIAVYDPARGWTMQVEMSTKSQDQEVTTIGNTIPLDGNRIIIAWLVTDVFKNGISHPGHTVVTTHSLDQRTVMTNDQLDAAEKVPDHFGGPAIATHGLLMLRSSKIPQRLLQWCYEEPLSSAVIASTDTLRELPHSTDFAIQDDGTLWSIDEGRVTRMGQDGMCTFDNKDGAAIDVDRDGNVFVQGDYLTVLRYEAASTKQ